jgi:hypothetical protein
LLSIKRYRKKVNEDRLPGEFHRQPIFSPSEINHETGCHLIHPLSWAGMKLSVEIEAIHSLP